MSSQTDMRGTSRSVTTLLAAACALVAAAVATGPAEAAHGLGPRHQTRPTSSPVRIASASSGQSGAMLGGFTSQGWPGFFQLSRNGRMLMVGAIGLDMACQPSGNQFSIEDDYSRVPITSNGKLHASINVPPRLLADGSTVGVSGSMDGSVNRTRTKLTGTWQLQVAYTQPGHAVDRCTSGTVRFTATR